MASTTNLVCLILAAGSSSRLGRSKQLLKVNSRSLLEHSIRAALGSAVTSTLVVLGANFEEHIKEIGSLDVEILHNREWSNGIGSSISSGIKKIQLDHKGAEAVIIMVCDQPFISSAHVNSLIEKYTSSGRKIVASSYAETVGVPALFDRKYFDELAALSGEEGAKKLLNRFRDDVEAVDFPRGDVDVDTPEDAAKLRKRSNE